MVLIAPDVTGPDTLCTQMEFKSSYELDLHGHEAFPIRWLSFTSIAMAGTVEKKLAHLLKFETLKVVALLIC